MPEIKWEKTGWVPVATKTAAPKPSKKAKPAKEGRTRVAEGDSKKKSERRPARGQRAVSGKRAEPHYLTVFDRAAKDKKPVLLYFTSDRCEDCRTMEKLVLRQKAVTSAAKNFHSVLVVREFVTRELAKKYGITSAPSLVLVGSDGKVKKTFRGRQSPRLLAKKLESFAKANAKRLKKAARDSQTKDKRDRLRQKQYDRLKRREEEEAERKRQRV